MASSAQDNEQSIREACSGQRWEAAAVAALDAYGSEIVGFLTFKLKSVTEAHEVFSMFSEDLWIGLPQFSWRCSMRTWLYTLARNAAARHRGAAHRRRERGGEEFETTSGVEHAIARVRSATHEYQRTDVKDRFRLLRDELDEEDQMLLVLRVDRNLSWRDLALAMTGDMALEEEALNKEAARLRKAFERVKGELRRLAQREGLLSVADSEGR
jgi:RNA polymerase sigma-70 factor, ECF subfamily